MPLHILAFIGISFVAVVALVVVFSRRREASGRRVEISASGQEVMRAKPAARPAPVVVPATQAPIPSPATAQIVEARPTVAEKRPIPVVRPLPPTRPAAPVQSISRPVVEESGPACCPYCFCSLSRRPKRKSACPECGRTIYVKYTPSDPIKRLVTEAALPEIERAWEGYNSAKARAATDREAAMFDLPPGLSQEETLEGMKAYAANPAKDIQQRKIAAFSVARLVGGREKTRWATDAYRLELERFLELGVREVTLRGQPCSPSCAALVGKTFSTAAAKSKKPVPNAQCPGWKDRKSCCLFWAMPLTATPNPRRKLPG